MSEYSVSFTGHRPNKLGGYDESVEKIVDIKNALLYKIIIAYEKGYTNFISGMAIGVDTWGAEAVIKLKNELPNITLTSAIPFDGQADRWPVQTSKRYYNILDNADTIHYVCDAGYATWKMQRRNEWMVDNSNLVIAVWDGTSGGTGHCVEYAKSKECEIWRIEP